MMNTGVFANLLVGVDLVTVRGKREIIMPHPYQETPDHRIFAASRNLPMGRQAILEYEKERGRGMCAAFVSGPNNQHWNLIMEGPWMKRCPLYYLQHTPNYLLMFHLNRNATQEEFERKVMEKIKDYLAMEGFQGIGFVDSEFSLEMKT